MAIGFGRKPEGPIKPDGTVSLYSTAQEVKPPPKGSASSEVVQDRDTVPGGLYPAPEGWDQGFDLSSIIATSRNSTTLSEHFRSKAESLMHALIDRIHAVRESLTPKRVGLSAAALGVGALVATHPEESSEMIAELLEGVGKSSQILADTIRERTQDTAPLAVYTLDEPEP